MTLYYRFSQLLIIIILIASMHSVEAQVMNNIYNTSIEIKAGDEYLVGIDIDGIAKVGSYIVQVPGARTGNMASIKIDRVYRKTAVGHVISDNMSNEIVYNSKALNTSLYDNSINDAFIFNLNNASIARIDESNQSLFYNTPISNHTLAFNDSYRSIDLLPGPSWSRDDRFRASPVLATCDPTFGDFIVPIGISTTDTLRQELDKKEREELARKEAKKWLDKGNDNYALCKWKDALNCYEEGIKSDKKNADLWYSKGNALLMMKKYDDALKAYDQATNLNPNYKKAWEAKCVILTGLNRTTEAKIACSKR